MAFIESKPKINAINRNTGTLSVTYTPVDTGLGLDPYHIQQLGTDKQNILDYAAGTITKPELKQTLWDVIVAASGQPSDHWNNILESTAATIPVDVDEDVGIELRAITQADVDGSLVENF